MLAPLLCKSARQRALESAKWPLGPIGAHSGRRLIECDRDVFILTPRPMSANELSSSSNNFVQKAAAAESSAKLDSGGRPGIPVGSPASELKLASPPASSVEWGPIDDTLETDLCPVALADHLFAADPTKAPLRPHRETRCNYGVQPSGRPLPFARPNRRRRPPGCQLKGEPVAG